MTSSSQPRSFGRYEVLRRLGRGAVGEVFLARDPALGRDVAVKTLSGLEALGESEREQAQARFLREARSAAALNHPNIVTIFDVGEQDGVPYIAMERLEGTTLDRHAREPHLLPMAKVVELGIQAAMALHEAHRAGIIHRDIKPANLVLCEDGSLKVADFGLAKEAAAALTSVEEVLGTPAYMAPEQIAGKTLDSRADLFSLAVSLFELLSGQRPFTGDTVSSVLYRVVNDPAPPLRSLTREAPAELESLIARMLAKSPDGRPADGHEVARALRSVLETLGGVPSDLVLPPPATPRSQAEGTGGGGSRGDHRETDQRRGKERRRTGRRTPAGVRPALALIGAIVVLIAVWLAPIWLGWDPLGSARRPVEDWMSASLGGVGDAVRVTTPLVRVEVGSDPPGLELTLEGGGGMTRLEGRQLLYPADRREPMVVAVDDPCREGSRVVDPQRQPEAVVVQAERKVVRVPVASDPSGARVAVDGRTVDGRTPTELELSRCEAHTITLAIEGRPERTLELAADAAPDTWRETLAQVPIAPPPDGEIVLEKSPHYPVTVLAVRNGRQLGSAGETITLPPGRHRLLLVNSEVLLRREVTVRVDSGRRRDIAVPYPALGTLRVISIPANARVLGRGAGGRRYFELGRTPLTGRDVIAGKIELKIVHPSSGDAATGAVRVRAGDAPTEVRVAQATGWKIAQTSEGSSE
jgi:hypothetical protein